MGKKEVKEIITNIDKLNSLGRATEFAYDDKEDNQLARDISKELKKVMRKHSLVSLSAPVIGYNKRIFCVDFSDKEIKTFINPLIMSCEGQMMSREICSAIPNKEYIRPRYKKVVIAYTTLNGQIKQLEFSDTAACVMQHEIDHLDNIFLSDVGLEVDKDFDDATEEERYQIIDMYIKSLVNEKNSLIEAIENNEELKKEYDADKFMQMLANKEIEITALQSTEEQDEGKDA